MEYVFSVDLGQGKQQIRQKDLLKFSALYGLDHIAQGRCSSFFVFSLMMLDIISGIDPLHVVEEMRVLEGSRKSLQTKPESQFQREPLKGLWHKHFMPALPSVMAHNITNHLGKNGLRKLVEEVMDPRKSPTITQEMVQELSNRIVMESMEQRADEGKLTGEWIVYAKEVGKNYYLGIWSHGAGDAKIASTIRSACLPEFPFLEKYVSPS